MTMIKNPSTGDNPSLFISQVQFCETIFSSLSQSFRWARVSSTRPSSSYSKASRGKSRWNQERIVKLSPKNQKLTSRKIRRGCRWNLKLNSSSWKWPTTTLWTSLRAVWGSQTPTYRQLTTRLYSRVTCCASGHWHLWSFSSSTKSFGKVKSRGRWTFSTWRQPLTV